MARQRDTASPGAARSRGVAPSATVATIDDVRDAMAESEFQRDHVVEGLQWRGFVVWTVPNMKMTAPGLFDLIAYREGIPGLLLLWELKRATGRIRHAQRKALAHAQTVPGVDARIVRPVDWSRLRDALDSRDPIAALAVIPRGI
jgi:hypothetical protein